MWTTCSSTRCTHLRHHITQRMATEICQPIHTFVLPWCATCYPSSTGSPRRAECTGTNTACPITTPAGCSRRRSGAHISRTINLLPPDCSMGMWHTNWMGEVLQVGKLSASSCNPGQDMGTPSRLEAKFHCI